MAIDKKYNGRGFIAKETGYLAWPNPYGGAAVGGEGDDPGIWLVWWGRGLQCREERLKVSIRWLRRTGKTGFAWLNGKGSRDGWDRAGIVMCG